MTSHNPEHARPPARSPDRQIARSPVPSKLPRSVVVVGCGLLGTSVALAIKDACPACDLTGIERDPAHRRGAAEMGCFREIQPDFQALTTPSRFDLAILAVPLQAACTLLPTAAGRSDVVMDICSAKTRICETALEQGLATRFVPAHPMAGLSSIGPKDARADLFLNRPWLLLGAWPAAPAVTPLIEAIGARVTWVDSAQEHDLAMSAVSHGVHVASLATMLAYADSAREQQTTWAALSGPGFRDITRLAASPTEFWADTLLSNAAFVVGQLARITARIDHFKDALEQGDRAALGALLDEAREARLTWEREQPGNCGGPVQKSVDTKP